MGAVIPSQTILTGGDILSSPDHSELTTLRQPIHIWNSLNRWKFSPLYWYELSFLLEVWATIDRCPPTYLPKIESSCPPLHLPTAHKLSATSAHAHPLGNWGVVGEGASQRRARGKRGCVSAKMSHTASRLSYPHTSSSSLYLWCSSQGPFHFLDSNKQNASMI